MFCSPSEFGGWLYKLDTIEPVSGKGGTKRSLVGTVYEVKLQLR